jgi:hypothetical protein
LATLTQAQRLDRFARALSADTGLTYDASYKWASAEVGPLNNLGVMLGPSTPAGFATPEAGAAAAADVIMHRNSYAAESTYSGIRASIASGDTTKQLTAIASSPWHLTPPAGQLDPYYARVFGLSGAGSAPGAITASPAPPSTPLPSDPLGRAQHYVAELTSAQARGVITTSTGQPIGTELAHYQGVVAKLTASAPSSTVVAGSGLFDSIAQTAKAQLSTAVTANPSSFGLAPATGGAHVAASPVAASQPAPQVAPSPAAASAAPSALTFDPTGTLVLIAAGVAGVLLLTRSRG